MLTVTQGGKGEERDLVCVYEIQKEGKCVCGTLHLHC